jgi:cyclomaltodextrin glucanotransferase
LATFNESNIEYRNYIKSAIKLWLDRGVDALRIDTVKHMPMWFWQEFNSDLQTHKPSLFSFGEWGFSKPWEKKFGQFCQSLWHVDPGFWLV